MIFKIAGKNFAFSTFDAAQKFREECIPYTETRFGGMIYLSTPENKGKILPDTEMAGLKVYDTVEECIKDNPQERIFKYMNEVKKVKSAIPLKSPLVFSNNMKGNEKMALSCNKICYDLLKEIIKKSNANIENKQIDLNGDKNVVVDKVYLKHPSKISLTAPITLKRYEEFKTLLKEVDKKIDAIKEDFGIAEKSEESERE